MELTKSIEEIKSRCNGLFSICFAAVDILANNNTLSETSTKVFEKLKANPEMFVLNSDEIKMIDRLQTKVESGWLNRAMWKIEEVGMFLWLLNLVDKAPPVWQQFDANVLKQMKDISNIEKLRDEADRYKEYLKTINWRFHFEFFSRMENISKETDQAKIISDAVNKYKAEGAIDEVVDGDIGFEGVSFIKLGYSKKESIRKITETRYKVFQWLEEKIEDEEDY